MIVPERTRRVHKIVIPFFLVKLGIIFLSLSTAFLLLLGVDYVHVLSSLGENKALKGENFKLRQEILSVQSKVDSMESTVERVRNYAKKLQLLTGQGDKASTEAPWNGADSPDDRAPAQERHSSYNAEPDPDEPDAVVQPASFSPQLDTRVEHLELVSDRTELSLSRLQGYLLTRSAVIAATPSIIPIAGWISSPFGYRVNPWDGRYRLHAGIDIAAESGTPVRAPANGIVIYSGYKEGYGKVVVIDHGYGIHTLFGHNSQLFVSVGEKVLRGEIISQVGSTGHSTGPHLHYEIRKNGIPVNPVPFFSRTRF